MLVLDNSLMKKLLQWVMQCLYALMNLGGFLPGIISPPVRRAFGITGVFWVYAALTVAGIAVVYFIITKKAMEKAVREANQDADGKPKAEEEDEMAGYVKSRKIRSTTIKNFPLKDLRILYTLFSF
ncbi:MAG: sugar porter family MFS transporter [Ignavibacteriales bacterium]|nr:sugar porter family MFS transporter [Ignavibacteriales bacterium]